MAREGKILRAEKKKKKKKRKLHLLLSPNTTDSNSTLNQSELEANTRQRRLARENAREQITINRGYAFDWLRKWCELLQPITRPNNTTPKQTQMSFNAQPETSLD